MTDLNSNLAGYAGLYAQERRASVIQEQRRSGEDFPATV